ncbi:sigma-54-dependent transcriptional regulator [Pokkaliibacter sp. CJK22405]|uniref:sigma-54-dependent transcriptional regulator n=1 Tax=Pokkaliibacter sp. CJK22405 TaxID=3384615 RepID=UPI0039851852
MRRILIVEDEAIIRQALKKLLERNDYQVDDAGCVDDALKFSLENYDLVISDLRLPGRPGTDLIREVKHCPVLIMTSYASLRSAVDAMREGAVDYIAKPFDHDEMLASVKRIIKQQDERQANAGSDVIPMTRRSARSDNSAPRSRMIGSCEAMQMLFRRIAKVAGTDVTVLIQGESGTGKELAARAIHEQSSRGDRPMISVNCAAIPESLIESELFGHEKGAFTGAVAARSGLIEAADTGTLFLDEVGELPLEAQARLLRVLQESEIRRVGSIQSKKVDIRLITATHRNLREMVKEGKFREDLFYRLYVMDIRMPALRERGDDIIEIADVLLERSSRKLGREDLVFSTDALHTLKRHPWPGNVRELENAIERAVILVDDAVITPDLLGIPLEDDELDQIEARLSATSSNTRQRIAPLGARAVKENLSLDDYFLRFVLEHQEEMSETELAQKLGVSRKCLWEKRQKLGIPRKK